MSAARYLAAALVCIACVAHAQPAPPSVDALRDLYPPTSIDSVAKADAALAATGSAKARVEKEFKAAARACIGNVLVNDCLDGARAQRRQRMADIDAIELEANRYKRRDRSEHHEQDRATREAGREAAAPADAALRARNRAAYEKKQADAAHAAADRAKSDAGRTVKKPPIRPQAEPASKQAERAKNAVEFQKKTRMAAEHQKEIDRRIAQKTTERKRRDEAKAVKDAKTVAAAKAAAAASSAPLLSKPLPSTGPKP